MFIVHVHVHVLPGHGDAFAAAMLENARESEREPGVLRFEVIRQVDDPARFVLVEIYRDEAAIFAHKQTAHYLKWRDIVAPMMAEPRRGAKYTSLNPLPPPAS